jgi:hypothetical protein
MKVPNHQRAAVPAAKVTRYLLSTTHPVGQYKATFFRAVGFTSARWEEMAAALRRHVADHDVVKEEPTPFGIRYVVEGRMETPDGRSPSVRSVWFIDTGSDAPRFVTAYPLEVCE